MSGICFELYKWMYDVVHIYLWYSVACIYFNCGIIQSTRSKNLSLRNTHTRWFFSNYHYWLNLCNKYLLTQYRYEQLNSYLYSLMINLYLEQGSYLILILLFTSYCLINSMQYLLQMSIISKSWCLTNMQWNMHYTKIET